MLMSRISDESETEYEREWEEWIRFAKKAKELELEEKEKLRQNNVGSQQMLRLLHDPSSK
jgi:hypothetical protein